MKTIAPLKFVAGERATRQATPTTPAFDITIESVKGRWVRIIGDDGSASSCARADLSPLVMPDPAPPVGYVGPMVALRRRFAAGMYHKAANGQPCCDDGVAQQLGALAPAQVIHACIIALALPENPYAHLNIGQQSMNLRNRLRGALKRGEFGMGVLAEAVEQAQEEAES